MNKLLISGLFLFCLVQTGLTQNMKKLQAAIDSTFRAMMQEQQVPGAIFCMVNADSVLMTRGYGVLDVSSNKPVDPQLSIFRVASVAKSVSAIGAMQLVDRGIMGLNQPINQYFKNFELKKRFDKPTTLAHFLTHTSGFDQRTFGRRTLDPAKMEPMVNYFPRQMPKQVFEPGLFMSYSTFIGSIPGYMTEEITGVPFDDYMVKNVFEPLDMPRTGYELKKLNREDLAVGYSLIDGQLREEPYEYTMTVPGTMLMTTANDMSHFLQMELNNGRYRGNQLLSGELMGQRHKVQFTSDPKLTGSTYGLYEMTANGKRILTHSGGFSGFMAQLYVLLDENIAFFMAFNQRNGGARINTAVRNLIFDQFIEQPEHSVEPEEIVSVDLNRFVGTYQATSFALSNIEKLSAFDGNGQWKISKGKGDTLLIQDSPYVPIGNLLFRYAHAPGSYLKFIENGKGKVEFLTFGGILAAHRKLPWYEVEPISKLWLILVMTIFAAALVINLIRFVRQRKRGVIRSTRLRFYNGWLVGISALSIISFLGTALAADSVGKYGIPDLFVFMIALLNLTALLSLLLPFLSYRIWQDRDWSRGYRAFYLTCTLVALLYLPFLVNWNLIGFNF